MKKKTKITFKANHKPNFTAEQQNAIFGKFDYLLEKINSLAKENGISDMRFEGFIVKSVNTFNPLVCPCGVELYTDPNTGKPANRCRKCPT